MKAYITLTVELDVDGLGNLDDVRDYAAELSTLLRFNHPTPAAGVTVEGVHAPIVEWE
jgi:hypothetical protein